DRVPTRCVTAHGREARREPPPEDRGEDPGRSGAAGRSQVARPIADRQVARHVARRGRTWHHRCRRRSAGASSWKGPRKGATMLATKDIGPPDEEHIVLRRTAGGWRIGEYVFQPA